MLLHRAVENHGQYNLFFLVKRNSSKLDNGLARLTFGSLLIWGNLEMNIIAIIA